MINQVVDFHAEEEEKDKIYAELMDYLEFTDSQLTPQAIEIVRQGLKIATTYELRDWLSEGGAGEPNFGKLLAELLKLANPRRKNIARNEP